MLLHHFTSSQHLKAILRQGLTMGRVPSHFDSNDRPYFISGYQWLTANPDFEQAWARPHAFSYLPYRRNQIRLFIDIPFHAQSRLIRWADFSAKYRLQAADFINSFPDAVHWKLFHGSIPPAWIVAADSNPTPIDLQFNEAPKISG